jgi:hypothetical protein
MRHQRDASMTNNRSISKRSTMAIILSYGNVPPSRGRVQLGEQVRAAEQLQMILDAHERWAASGELCNGLLYTGPAWTTTSTSYVAIGTGGSEWDLSRWCPLVRFDVPREGGSARVEWRAYVRNLRVLVTALADDYSTITTNNASATDNTPQWIGGALVPTSSAGDVAILKVTAQRLTHDSTGTLYHFGARSRPSAASQIPGQP